MNHADELVHRHSEGQRFFGNVGPGRHIEHADDGPGTGGVFFEIGVLHDRAAACRERTEDAIRFGFVIVGEGEESGKNIRGREKDDSAGIVRLLKHVEALENDKARRGLELRDDLQHLFDELGGLFVPLAFELAGNAAGQEIFERGADVLGKAGVALAPRSRSYRRRS